MTLTDEKILQGFRNGDAFIVKKYYYSYCRMAYNLYNQRYNLQDKPGLDFYSLAHEYYIYLFTHDWHTLEDRPATVPLSTWMIGGFRFVVLDALKAWKKENNLDDLEKMPEQAGRDHAMQAFTVRDIVDNICSDLGNERDVLIFRKILLEGYQEKEVAQLLGISASAVNQRYQKIRNHVRPMLKRESRPPMQSTMAAWLKDDGESYACMQEPEPIIYDMMHTTRITPDFITSLQDNEVFVFGSNLGGYHGGGAAALAMRRFGAVWGQGVGMQGQSYAIPTMQGGPETIQPYVDEFIDYAKAHPELRFLVTRIGCGIAGFEPEDIAPLFRNAADVENICLPDDFWEILNLL